TPLTFEANLVRHRRAPAPDAFPIVDPVCVTFAEGGFLTGADGGAGLGQETGPRREGGAGGVGGPVAVRRPQGEQLPPRLPGRLQPVHEAVRLASEAATRERGDV